MEKNPHLPKQDREPPLAKTCRQRRKALWTRVRSLLQWGLGALVFGANVGILFFLGFFLSQEKLDAFLQCMAAQMIWVSGIKLRVEGEENIDRDQTYILIFNHINFFDHFVLFRALKLRKLRGIEKESHFSWPIYGTFLRKIHILPIAPRGDTRRARASLEKAKDFLAQGYSMGIAPEGTRSIDGKLQAFKKGAFHLAIQTKATLLPVVLINMDRFNLKSQWDLHPCEVTVRILPPIDASTYHENQVTTLRNHCHRTIAMELKSS
ncbi:MAG: lysophospholipid acyltransferase family protein [Bdellovibrionota bacterium]